MKHWIIACIIAVAYFAASLASGAWQWTWLIWLGYAAYRLIDNAIHSKQEDDR